MNQALWARLPGGAAHFPVALSMAAVAFDAAGGYRGGEIIIGI